LLIALTGGLFVWLVVRLVGPSIWRPRRTKEILPSPAIGAEL
jgi:hypothetical protein